MKIHRFFVEEKLLNKGKISITDPEVLHQWSKVFRFGVGDSVILFDGGGEDLLCEITLLTKKGAELSVRETHPSLVLPSLRLTIYLSLIKKDNFEWVLQKGTELGVASFVPILSERSEKKEEEKQVKIQDGSTEAYFRNGSVEPR